LEAGSRKSEDGSDVGKREDEKKGRGEGINKTFKKKINEAKIC